MPVWVDKVGFHLHKTSIIIIDDAFRSAISTETSLCIRRAYIATCNTHTHTTCHTAGAAGDH